MPTPHDSIFTGQMVFLKSRSVKALKAQTATELAATLRGSRLGCNPHRSL